MTLRVFLLNIHKALISWYILVVIKCSFIMICFNMIKYISIMTHIAFIWLVCPHTSGYLTHWGRVMHICIGKLTIIGPDNGLSPGRRQAIIWTNAAILLIGPLGTNLSEFLNEIQTFPLKRIRLKMLSAKCCLFHLGLNVLTSIVAINCRIDTMPMKEPWRI